jgi:hypothetical protein
VPLAFDEELIDEPRRDARRRRCDSIAHVVRLADSGVVVEHRERVVALRELLQTTCETKYQLCEQRVELMISLLADTPEQGGDDVTLDVGDRRRHACRQRGT